MYIILNIFICQLLKLWVHELINNLKYSPSNYYFNSDAVRYIVAGIAQLI